VTAFLTIGQGVDALDVRCAVDQCTMTGKRTEDRARALDGTMMVVVGPTIRTWDVKTHPLNSTDFNALLTALQAAPQIVVSGAWIGSTLVAWPRLASSAPVAAGAAPRALNFSFIESLGTPVPPAVIASEHFEPPMTDVTASPTWWGVTWTSMEAGDAASTGSLEHWGVLHDGTGGLPSQVYDGVQAMTLIVGYELSDVASRDVFLRRVFTGLTPDLDVVVTMHCGVGFHTDSPPAACPIGLRVNTGTPVTTTVLGSWLMLSAAGTTDGSGNLTVDIGTFGMAGTDGYPLQRVCRFDDIEIRPAA
jgi:hypothetical protein